jgi:hypothetical protein
VLIVQEHKGTHVSPDIGQGQEGELEGYNPAHANSADSVPEANKTDTPTEIPMPEISVQAEDRPATSVLQTASAVMTKTTPMRSVSHDLPTPPVSEGGDDVGGKDAPVELVDNVGPKLESLGKGQDLQGHDNDKLPSMPSSRWSQGR